MRIIVIGPRSVGKSAVGRALGERVDVDYFDFDEYVEGRLGDIDYYIEKSGADSYRLEEEKVLEGFILGLPSDFVVSVGGGTVASQLHDVSEKNAARLKKAGVLVYLVPSDDKNKAVDLLFRSYLEMGIRLERMWLSFLTYVRMFMRGFLILRLQLMKSRLRKLWGRLFLRCEFIFV